jgi:hypothetical protein
MTDLQLLQEFAAYVRGTKRLPRPGTRRYIDCYLHSSHWKHRTADASGPVEYWLETHPSRPFVGAVHRVLTSRVVGFWPGRPDSYGRWTGDVYIFLTEPVVVTLEFQWPHPIEVVFSPGTLDRITFTPTVRGYPKHISLTGWDSRTGATHVLELVVNEYYP